MANLASIEFHILLSDAEDPTRPCWMVFDLDPRPSLSILDCGWLALELRRALAGVNLVSLVKTSGGKGLHVCVPLNSRVTFDETKSVARGLAELLARQHPSRVTTNMRKSCQGKRPVLQWKLVLSPRSLIPHLAAWRTRDRTAGEPGAYRLY